jgi:hypothetical protein
VAPRTEARDLLAVDRDDGRPVGDDEETDPAVVALPDDHFAGRKGPLGEVPGELLEMLPIEAREHRDLGEGVHHVR